MKFIEHNTAIRFVQHAKIQLCIFVFPVMFLLSIGCSSQDKYMERKLSNKLVELKKSKMEYLDLRTVFGDEWEEVCIRGPYEPNDHFEKRVGRKVPMDDSPRDDGIYVFWVFDRDGKVRWAQVSRLNVMDCYSSKGTPCTTIDKPYIYASNDNGERKYYFQGREK
jgi:hypothetical protein